MTDSNKFKFEIETYKSLLKAVASMSRLYSDNNTAFIHPRFVEKLYAHCSGARDLSRRDMSFDAILDKDIGVGIKTFIANNQQVSKSEKIAEFTHQASQGALDNLDHHNKAVKVAELRNSRIISDANEYSININNSIYHCLVRTNSGAIIHEEPYQLVDVDAITPTDQRGKPINNFSPSEEGHTYFSDEKSNYYFNRSKNVLFKKFDLNNYTNSEIMPLEIFDDIFEKILNWTIAEINLAKMIIPLDTLNQQDQSQIDGTDYVILPLYGSKNQKGGQAKQKVVQEKSGINAWNAAGRKRQFGEAYIPIPMGVHKKAPNFFPDRDEKFNIKLPNGKIICAKVCQQNDKALMSDPNTDLCAWLYDIIDTKKGKLKTRGEERIPYTYEDLIKVGKDSVKIIKVTNSDYSYEMKSTALGSFEDFMNNEEED